VTEETNILAIIAKQAGEYLRGSTETAHTEKSNAKDFVTVADIKLMDIVGTQLRKHFPNDAMLSEEDPEAERQQLFDPGFTGFVIDPIDGTYNFKRDMRESAISIGHVTDGEPDWGVIYDPYKDELYVTEKGKGAFRNGRPIHVSDHARIEGASIATSNSYDDKAMARNLRRHVGIYEQGGVMPWTNVPGSGVLIMTYIACGRFDIYHHNGLKPWDNAVAFLLIREAGGVVHDLQGRDAKFTSPTVLAGNPKLVDSLEAVFSKLPQELLQ
jgi:myo-inositol-1(or 4)-monophosphatase